MNRIHPLLATLVFALATIPLSDAAQTADRMTAAARAVLEARASGMPGNWEFVVDSSLPDIAEDAPTSVKAGDIDGRWPRSRVGVPVHAKVKGKAAQSHLVWFNVHRWQDVPVYTVDARAGDGLDGVHMHLQRQDMARFGDATPLPERASDAGLLRLKRSVRAGQPVLRDDFESLPAVARQKNVVLTVTQGSVRLHTRAMAQKDAAMGELVRVLPSGADQWVKARVTGPGEVSLEN